MTAALPRNEGIPPYSHNSATNDLVQLWYERWRIYRIIEEAGYFTAGAMERQHQRLADEASAFMDILVQESRRGELTEAGMKEVASLFNSKRLPSGLTPTFSDATSSAKEKSRRIKVQAKQRSEIDADKFAAVLMGMAQDMVEENVNSES